MRKSPIFLILGLLLALMYPPERVCPRESASAGCRYSASPGLTFPPLLRYHLIPSRHIWYDLLRIHTRHLW